MFDVFHFDVCLRNAPFLVVVEEFLVASLEDNDVGV